MKLPYWVDEEFEGLPNDFSGSMIVECYRGAVTRVETKTIRTAPKAGEIAAQRQKER